MHGIVGVVGDRGLDRGLHQLDRGGGIGFVDLGRLQFLFERDDDFREEENLAILAVED